MKQLMIGLLVMTFIFFLWRIMGFGFYVRLAFLAYVSYWIIRFFLSVIAGPDDGD